MCQALYEKAMKAQEQSLKVMMEAQKMKDVVSAQTGKDVEKQFEMEMIPMAMYELAQERNDCEKRQIRKSYRTIVAWISGVLVALLIGIFGLAFYFLSNYEISTYSQDGDGINNVVGDYSTQGDMNYGASDKGNQE